MKYQHESAESNSPAPTLTHLHIDEAGHRAGLRLSDGEQLELAHDAPELARLQIGQAVPAATLAALRSAATRKRMAKDVFQLLKRRPLTRARLRERLRRDCDDLGAIDAVLAQCAEQGLIDDRRFAELFLEDQLRARAIGPLSLLHRMAQQGVPPELARSVVSERIDSEREVELATRALGRRAIRAGMDAREHMRQQRFLRSRGFGARAIAAALRPASAGEAADGDAID
jgi:regulatory protein